ncbi:MAG: hypothetical protein O3A06_13365 [Proteobacteria bacterium]|nr:hypothetical protein [Pseudomonadota bacterium]MDA0983979.1 hypothetical protein [Pseudomonadota bacterium]
MWVVYLEMAFALALLILIVWFTWPKKKPGAAPGEGGNAGTGRDGPESRN